MLQRCRLLPLLCAALATGCAGAKASHPPGSLTLRELTIVDAQGTPRLRLEVDRDGTSRIEPLAPAGK
jgi:hypothetical protein